MAGPAARPQLSSSLVSAAYLTVLAIVVACIGWFVWNWFQLDQGLAPSVAKLSDLDLKDAPSAVSDPLNVRDEILRLMTPEQAAQRAIDTQLRELERSIRDKISGKPSINPGWINPAFTGVGIDPQKFSRRVKDSTLEVQRYVGSESAPSFKGKRAFDQFVTNSMSSMTGCRDIRVKLRLEKLTGNAGKFDVTILAIAAGARDQSKVEWEETGKEKLAIQTTSIWNTSWGGTQSHAERFRLDEVAVSASEKVTLSLNNSRLFFDCTESIFDGCECLRQQLVFGMDEWASKLPGVDVRGNQGLAIGDLNGDGLDDIYICQPRGLPNLLLMQKNDGTVVDESEQSRANLLDDSRATLILDFDNDGDQDMAIATTESLLLLSNDGNGKFQIENKLVVARRGLSLAAADFDNDGDLDLFLCRQLEQSTGNRAVDRFAGNSLLLRNDESFQFTRVDIDAELADDTPLTSRSAVWHDRDLDGDQDLDLASDELGNLAFENNDGTLTRLPSRDHAVDNLSSRSLSVGDFNGDGVLDLLVANGSGSTNHESFVKFGGQQPDAKPFFLRQPLFSNQLANTSVATDVNNDGRDDIVIGNGGFTRIARNDSSPLTSNIKLRDQAVRERMSLDSRQSQRCFASIGGTGFAELSAESGLNFPEDARAIATTDWDHDGDTDILVLSRTGPQLRIFMNVLNQRNSVAFLLKGTDSNRSAIGARVEVFFKGKSASVVKTIQAGSGCRSQSSARLLVGAGDNHNIESAVIHWPSGLKQQFSGLSVGATYELTEGNQSLVEKIDGRYRLKVRASPLVGNLRVPLPSERVMLYPRSPIPNLEVQVGESKWSEFRCSDQRSTLVLLWGQNSESDQSLARLERMTKDLESQGTDVVTLFAGNSDLRPDENWKYISNFHENLPGVKNWFSLSEAGRQQLEIVSGHLFSRNELPSTPLLMLLDSQQRLAAIYPADALKKKQLISDIDLCNVTQFPGSQESIYHGVWADEATGCHTKNLFDELEQSGYSKSATALLPTLDKEKSKLLVAQSRDFMASNRFDQAKKLCLEATRLDPDNERAHLASADAIVMSTTRAAAEFPIEGSASLDLAKEHYERALEIEPGEWRAAVGIAKLMLMQGETSKALKTLDSYLKQDSERAEVQAMYGRICFQTQDYAQAKRYLSYAYNQRPALPFLAGDLGYLYLVTGEHSTALKLLRIAHQRQPSDLHFFRLLAEAEFIKGNFHKAVDLYQQVSELVPEQSKTRNVLAWLLATCPYETKRDGAAAIDLIAPKPGQLIGKDPATLEIYAACFAEVGDFEKAIDFQQQAVDQVESLANPAYSKAQVKGMLSRLELFRSQQPYRTADTTQTPVAISSGTETNFQALRF